VATCPRCDPAQELSDAGDCGSCGGRLLEQAAAERLLHDELGHDVGKLRQLAELFAGERLRCPSCAGQQSPLTLKGVPIDLCLGCGAVWLDAGEGEALTALATGSTAPPPPARSPPRAPSTVDEVVFEGSRSDAITKLALAFGAGLAALAVALSLYPDRSAGMPLIVAVLSPLFGVALSERVRVTWSARKKELTIARRYGELFVRRRTLPGDAIAATFVEAQVLHSRESGSHTRVRTVVEMKDGARVELAWQRDSPVPVQITDAVARATGCDHDGRVHIGSAHE
jgi:Zn-finger nucleic acid-binding protein